MGEQNNIIEPKKEKNNKGVIVALIIIIILLIGVIGILLLKPAIFNTTDQNNNNSNLNETTKTTNEKQKLETFDLSNFDNTKLINGDNMEYIDINEAKESLVWGNEKEVIATKLHDDQKTVSIRVNWKELGGTSLSENTYTVSLNNKIRKIYVSGWGLAIGDETIFYLMEDGTIQYTPLNQKIVQNEINNPGSTKLKSYGKISEAKDIVMIAKASAHSTGSYLGYYHTVLAIKSDGSFYDLPKILEKTETYNYR